MKINVSVKYQTRICDAATGAILKESPMKKNLVLDRGLNAFAKNPADAVSPAGSFLFAKVGSGTNANSFASGAVTFTQAATTLTASAGFFTSAMVGGLFKWGTGSGGNEIYITAFTSSTVVTVGTSATVAVAEVGTVYQVQQTTLQTHLYSTNTYQTNTGDCSTTFVNGTVTFQRTFIIPQQGASYNVNEIGWSNVTGSGCFGRAVLSATDVVGTSNFYVLVLQLTLAYSPAVPTAVADLGVNFNTAGNAQINWMNMVTVSTTGNLSGTSAAGTSTDPGLDTRAGLSFAVATYTQPANPTSTTSITWTGKKNAASLASWAYASSLGKMSCTFAAFSFSVAAETCYGFGMTDFSQGFNGQPFFNIKLTTPVSLGTGTFSGTVVFHLTFSRTLTN